MNLPAAGFVLYSEASLRYGDIPAGSHSARAEPARVRSAARRFRAGPRDRARTLRAGAVPSRIDRDSRRSRDRVRSYRTLHMTPIALFAEYQRPLNRKRARMPRPADSDKADEQRRDQGRANPAANRDARGGRGADDARDRRAAAVAGSDDRILVQSLQYFRRQGPRQHLDRRVRGDCDSAAYVRQVPHAARRDRASSRDALLPRQLAEHRARQSRLEGQVRRNQRELRARADGAAHARRQRRLLAGRRNRARAHSDRMGPAQAPAAAVAAEIACAATAATCEVRDGAALFPFGMRHAGRISCARRSIPADFTSTPSATILRARLFWGTESKAAESTKASRRWTFWRAVPPRRII